MRTRHWTLFLAVALVGALLDLLTKHLAFEHIRSRWEEVRIIDGFFSFGRTTNPGVVFGMGQGAKWVWLLISVLAVPAIGALFWSVKKPRWILTISLGMILAGTVGNMYDRTFTAIHEVRDFIKFIPGIPDWIPYLGGLDAWPWVFNVADSALVVGVIFLLLQGWRDRKVAPAASAA